MEGIESSIFHYTDDWIIIPFPHAFPLSCDLCSAKIEEASFKRDLLRHATSCRGRPLNATRITDIRFECNYCKCFCPDRRKATTHQGSRFTEPNYNLQTYPCANCQRSLGTQKVLSSHVKACKRVEQRPPTNLPPTPNGGSEETRATLPDAMPEPSEYSMPALPSQHSPFLEQTDHLETNPSMFGELEQVSQDPLPELGIYGEAPSIPVADIDQWLENLIPRKAKRNHATQNKKTVNRDHPAEIQKLYSQSMKKALAVIQGHPDIECNIAADTIHCDMSAQFAKGTQDPVTEEL